MIKDTWKYWINGKGYHYFKSFKVYTAYKENGFRDLKMKDFNESFTGQFLANGFDVYGYKLSGKKTAEESYTELTFNWIEKKITPTQNWFGTSVYEPDTLFVKGDLSILMSLQGASVPYKERYETLFKERAVKYICLKKENNIVYEDYTGNIPSKELINNFLNS